MELKKNPKVDLSRQYLLFLNIGLILSLVVTITAFEWKFYDDLQTMDLGELEDEFDETIEIPITEMPPPPPPVLQQPEIVEVPDDEEIEEQVEIELDVEVDDTPPPPNVPIKIDAPPPPPPKEEKKDEIFLIVEQQPEPEGGMQAFYKYVAKKIKYPKQARRMGVEGRVYVQFVVGKDGSLTDIKVIKGIGSGCDEEAVRVLKEAPKWKPGKQRGNAVKVRMSMPIFFKLN